jgi:hypothetical protein
MSFSIKQIIKGWTSIQKILCGIVIFLILFISYLFFGYQHIKSATPPEGYIYPHAPTLVGMYFLEIDYKNTRSRVNDRYIDCGSPGLWTFGGGAKWGDKMSCCWLGKELKGKKVIVERKYLLTSNVSVWFPGEWYSPYVSKIISIADDRTYYCRSDRLLRQQWIDASRRAVFFNAIFFAGVVVACYLSYTYNYIGESKNV